MKREKRTCLSASGWERMVEEIPDSEYRMYQHFFTNSKWSHRDVLCKVGTELSHLLKSNKTKSNKPTGLIVDESSHLKKGNKSVAVGRQYAGVIGKVDNCQVGDYASMVNDNRAGVVNERLFIAQSWTDDKKRCEKAGIPEDQHSFKTKPQLALDMIDEMINNNVEFDWVGGDGLYGHNTELRMGLDQRELLFILDVHKDEKVFLSYPEYSIVSNSGKRGRPSKKLKPNIDSIRLDKYVGGLENEDWSEPTKIRKTQKGWKEQIMK
ncbi:MAG: transposase [Reichenbachiella sp.]